MLKNKTTRAVVVGAAVLAVVAGAAVAASANAATQTNGSQGKVYIGDSNSNALVPAGHVFGWNDDTFGFGDSANVSTPYTCPADATGSVSFLAPKGQEFTLANWSATGTSLFYPSDSKNVAQFTTSLYGQNTGNAAAVKASGGDFSVGLACTVNNGTKLASTGVYFASVHITAVTGAYTVDQPTEDVVVTPPPVSRLSGDDRFATSAAISTAKFAPGIPVLYIANGYNFPDALSGAPVAGKDGAPVLLVSADSIPASIQTELTRLKPGRIVVLGGTSAVSNAVASALQQYTDGAVTRLAGGDRFATSSAISAATFAPAVPVAYIANGYNFPDALSGAPVAGKDGAPVLLVSADSIPASIQAELTRLKPARIVILGGTSAVSAAVSQQLEAYISK